MIKWLSAAHGTVGNSIYKPAAVLRILSDVCLATT